MSAACLAALLNDSGYDRASLPTDHDDLYTLITALAFFDDTAEE
jgi:hypothetical protein